MGRSASCKLCNSRKSAVIDMEMFVLLSEVSAIYSRMIGDYKSMEYISKVREAKRRMGD